MKNSTNKIKNPTTLVATLMAIRRIKMATLLAILLAIGRIKMNKANHKLPNKCSNLIHPRSMYKFPSHMYNLKFLTNKTLILAKGAAKGRKPIASGSRGVFGGSASFAMSILDMYT